MPIPRAGLLIPYPQYPGGVYAITTAGMSWYHALQARLNARKKDDDNFLSRALEVVEMIQAAGADPRGGKYLEIGTGWRPFVPFLLYLIGAEQIITYDVNRWLSQAYALQTFAALADRVGLIAERLKLDVADLQKRVDLVGTQAERAAGGVELGPGVHDDAGAVGQFGCAGVEHVTVRGDGQAEIGGPVDGVGIDGRQSRGKKLFARASEG